MTMRQPSSPDMNGNMHLIGDPEKEVTLDEVRGHLMRIHAAQESVAKNVNVLMREHRKSRAMHSSGVVGIVGIVVERVIESTTTGQATHPQSLSILFVALVAMFYLHRRGAAGLAKGEIK